MRRAYEVSVSKMEIQKDTLQEEAVSESNPLEQNA